ncbi:MAG: single-stranded DNA-binding protein [Eubacteriales bacterium]|nr:single-stranded DNA-binding protein [Eubacteriales bacterium]
MNKVVLMGRLTRDPDIRYTNDGICIARYSLAVDRRKANQQGQREADFIGCVAFGKNAEFAKTYLNKGTKIAIVGRIQTGSYTNSDTGAKVYTTDVVVEEHEFAEAKSSNNTNASNYTSADVGDGFMSIPDGIEDEGLPFN